MLKNLFFCLFIGLGFCQSLAAQLTLTNAPDQGQFFAQNKKTNTAAIAITGFVDNTIYSKLIIKVLKKGVVVNTYNHVLSFSAGKAFFNQNLILKTGKHFYTIKYELSGGASYSEQVSEICVGDVYLVQGQSNAVASSFNPFDPKYNDPFLRSFGSSSPNANACLADTAWHGFNASSVYSSGSVGQWAGVMAKHLLDSFDTPICILNGAVGGTRIDQHQPVPWYRDYLYTIYGRLLYRAKKAKLDSSISGIIYFQGESDGGNAVKHDTQFADLYNYWLQDFPGFKKLYVIQVREGCGNPSLQLREVQRQFEFKLKNCQSVSANGLNNHDGCHYGFVDGYEKLGMQMSKLLGRDFYWSKERTNINPPNIKSCYYSNGLQTEITLNLTEPTDIVYTDINFENLFKIEGDNSVNIISGSIKNNQVTLTLNKSSCLITGLSYDGLRGNQPWVKNNIGFGLISFHNVPVQNHNVKESVFSCKNKRIIIGTNNLFGVTYELKQLSSGKVFTTSQLAIALNSSDTFRLTMSFDSLPCSKKDTAFIYIEVDNVYVPNLGKDTNICIGKSMQYTPIKNNFFQFQWTVNDINTTDFSITVDSSAVIKLSAHSNYGCKYESDVVVTQRQPKVLLDSSFYVCKDSVNVINLRDTFRSYYWNTLKGNSSSFFKPGNHSITAVDSFGCVASASFNVYKYAETPLPTPSETVCTGTFAKILKPLGFNKWLYLGSELGDSIYLSGINNFPLILEDTNKCLHYDTIKTQLFTPLPYPTIIDTAVCVGSMFELKLPANAQEYWVNNISYSDSIILIPFANESSYKIKDNNDCYLEGRLKLKQTQLPILSQFKDTIICSSDSLPLILKNGIKAYVDTKLITSNYYFKPNSNYNIKLVSTANCEAGKSIFIQSINCISHNKQIKGLEVSVYPNPFRDYLIIKSDQEINEIIYLYDFSGKLVLSKLIQNKVKINVSKLPVGMYYLKTSAGIWKIMKEK